MWLGDGDPQKGCGEKLKMIHYRHQGRSAGIVYIWDALVKITEADTEVLDLLIAHKEYGILEKAPP